ncbi:MAG: LysM peptidoglycan-binding domain-containing protein [Tepidisphaeraceae bacterium]
MHCTMTRKLSTALLLAATVAATGCHYEGKGTADNSPGNARPDVLSPTGDSPAASDVVTTTDPRPMPAEPPAKVSVPVAPAEPVAPPVAKPTGPTKYTIQKGDTLWKIAVAHYGDGQKWKAIADANPGLNGDKIQAGKVIVLP